MRTKKNSIEGALGYAFLLLKFRLRSEKEIRGRLVKRKIDPQIINKVVDFLKSKNFIDDQLFAKSWIRSRLKRPLGMRRLMQELKLKGVDQAIIESQIKKAQKDYSESEVVKKLADEKFRKIKGVDRYKVKQRIYRYLHYRGFSTDAIIEALRQLSPYADDQK